MRFGIFAIDLRRLLQALSIAAVIVALTASTAAAEQNQPPQETEAADSPVPQISLGPGQGLHIRGEDDEFGLQARGIFQGFYEFETAGGQPDHSSFYLRFLRADIQGHAFGEDLSFRLLPEFAGGQTRLLDGWVSYRFHQGFQLRGGQFTVPFNWERHAPPVRQQFGDRSTANNQFQWPGGRDIGLMAHGDPMDEIRYGVGIFSGQGANIRRSASPGHLVSGRVVYTPIGEYQTSEILVSPSQEANLSIGAGAFYAHQNSVRDWAPQSALRPAEADVVNTTADISLRWWRLSAHLSGFYRDVMPGSEISAQPDGQASFPRFQGLGATANVGALLIPERLLGTFRFSEAQPDLETDVARQRELTGGIHLFHRGNNSRFLVEAGLDGAHDGAEDWQYDALARVSYQLLF